MAWTPSSKAYVFASVGSGEPRILGSVAQTGSGFMFAYAQSWLASPDAFAVDPINLPLTDRQYTSRRMWGCFLDATPDNWGRKVLLSTHNQHPQNDIEWLLVSRGVGVGGMLFSASRHQLPKLVEVPEFADIEQLLIAASDIAQGLDTSSMTSNVAKLLWHGSSMGGARPKITVRHEGSEWIAKLSRNDDVFNQPRAEFASLQMASDAGIPVPAHKLVEVGNRTILMIERFDRMDGGRAHYLSANALIAPDRVRENDPNSPMSYLAIADVIKKISSDASADLHDLYRRMVLNVLIANTDDHLKNHGFLMGRDNTYRLSPAFDILPHPGSTQLQALVVGTQGRESSIDNVLSAHARFGLSRSEAEAELQSVAGVASQAAQYFNDAGMNKLEVGILAASCSKARTADSYIAIPKPTQGMRP